MENESISVPSKIITEHNGYTCEYKLVKVTAYASKGKPETLLDTETDALFEELFSTLFALDESFRTTSGNIKQHLINNADNPTIKAIGFNLDKLQYCVHYRAFLKYIASLDGVKVTPHYIKGVRPKFES